MKRSQNNRRAKAIEFQLQASDLFIAADPYQGNKDRNLQEALVKTRRSLLLDPNNYDTLVLMGKIYSALEDKTSVSRALECYDRAIALAPENSDAYSDKADLLMYYLNCPDEAERLARTAVSLSRQKT